MKNVISGIRVTECTPSEKNTDAVSLKLEQDVQTTYDGTNEHITNSFGISYGTFDNKRTCFFYLPTDVVKPALKGKVYDLKKVEKILAEQIEANIQVTMDATDTDENPLVRIRKVRSFSPFYKSQKPVRGNEPPSEKSGFTYEEDVNDDGDTVYVYLKDGKPFYQVTGICFNGEADIDGTVQTAMKRFNVTNKAGVAAGISE